MSRPQRRLQESHVLSGAEIRDAWRAWLSKLDLQHELTFNFGGRIRPQTGLAKMKLFCCKLEREAFGPRWFKKSQPDLVVIGFAEHLQSNCHWHCLASMPEKFEDAVFVHGRRVWKDLAPRGQLNFDRVQTSQQQAASYFTKELALPDRLENIFTYYGRDRDGSEAEQRSPRTQ
jgi:hypothetical protein